MSSATSKVRAALAALLFASVVAGTAGAEVTPRASAFKGTFSTTQAGAGLNYDISGTAMMVVRPAGTRVRVKIVGLEQSKVYPSHLHNGTCAADDGGAHYQDQDDGFGAITPPNELWLSSRGADGLKANRHGMSLGGGESAWAARTTSTTQTNALSIVVHEPNKGPRIACADLSSAPRRSGHSPT